MALPVDSRKLESFLRQTRREAPINKAHKGRLRHELFSRQSRISIFQNHFFLTISGSVVALMVLFILHNPSTPVVGEVEWQSTTRQTETVLASKRYVTKQDTAILRLNEDSRLRFLPGAVFSVLSSSSDRIREDAVILLERGILEASATGLLPYDLVVRTPDVEVRVIGTKFIVRVTEVTSPRETP